MKFSPSSHTRPHVATVDGGDLFGVGAGQLVAELNGDQHLAGPSAILRPSALDPDGFPSGRVSNQRLVVPSSVGTVS